MPIRRVNFTGRRRILREHVTITVRRGDPGTRKPAEFDAHLDLKSYGFPADALVTVEAYRQTTRTPFRFGTVSVLRAPEKRTLDDFDSCEAVLFRVRVTDVDARYGVLLGEADQIKPRMADDQDDDRVALLPVAPGDLGDQIWRIEFEGRPILRVNEALENCAEAVKSEQFRALVFPAAVREVLRRILMVEDARTMEDPDSWTSLWLQFAKNLPGVGPLTQNRSDDSDEEWIEQVVDAFSRRFGMLKRYREDFFGIQKN